jgi:carboxymethylenebutenolidase
LIAAATCAQNLPRWGDVGVVFEFHRYLAHHGFSNETVARSGRMAVTQYDAVGAQEVWGRTLRFFGRNLG